MNDGPILTLFNAMRDKFADDQVIEILESQGMGKAVRLSVLVGAIMACQVLTQAMAEAEGDELETFERKVREIMTEGMSEMAAGQFINQLRSNQER